MLISCLFIPILTFFFTSNFAPHHQRILTLLSIGAIFWITEIIPLAATSLLIALLQPLLGINSFTKALSPFFDPIVVLLLGGFLLARAIDKHELDQYIANLIIKRVGKKPKTVVLGLMLTTAFLSMWISNTASAALMIAITLPICQELTQKDKNFEKIAILSVAYSATLGGFLTLVGSPPNALASAFLLEMVGKEIHFISWIMYALPLSIVLIFTTWVVLFRLFPIKITEIDLSEKYFSNSKEKIPFTFNQKVTSVIFILTIFLWLTTSFHGLSSSMVAIISSILLFSTKQLNKEDFKKIEWGTLVLFGGGLSLGVALGESGISSYFVNFITATVGDGNIFGIVLFLGIITFIFSIVASNTVAASVFIPISINIALHTGINPTILAVLVSTTSSTDFLLPVGTPPNAIAYSTGKITIQDMIKAGLIPSILGVLLAVIFSMTIWVFVP
ncbi:MAG: SLC13 family permease [Candidatus Ranarchaeia archaeon]